VVGIGTRFDDRMTGRHDGFAPRARIVHLDVDAEELDRLVASDVGIAAPLRPALQALLAALRPLLDDGPRLEAWHAQLAEWHEAFGLRYAPGEPDELKPQAVLEALRDRTAGRDDVVFTTGVGQHQMWAMQYLTCVGPRQFLSSGGLGTMGYGLPAAVGARAARPDATVVCVDGDGSFAMTAQELATAVAEDLPVVVVVVNNAWLGMVRQWQDRFHGGRRSESHLGHAGPELAALARAYGCEAATVETPAELGPALDAALAARRPFVLDCRCSPTEAVYPMLPPGAVGRDVVELADVEALPAEAR
jgi:acetolactate synthase-1/2/3 large subunit